MKKVLWILGAALLLVPASVFAQGSGSVGGGVSSSGGNYDVARTLKCLIEKVDIEKNVVLIRTEDDKIYQFEITDKTKFKASRKSVLHGNKDISLADFAKGYPIRVTYKPENPAAATEIRVLKDGEVVVDSAS